MYLVIEKKDRPAGIQMNIPALPAPGFSSITPSDFAVSRSRAKSAVRKCSSYRNTNGGEIGQVYRDILLKLETTLWIFDF